MKKICPIYYDNRACISGACEESVWTEIWNDNTPGTEAGIKIYLPELVKITQTALTSQSWLIKAQVRGVPILWRFIDEF